MLYICKTNYLFNTIKMNRTEKLKLLLEIEEAKLSFWKKVNEAEWSNHFGAGLEFESIRKKNTHNIEIWEKCIDRLNERFTKQLKTLK